MLDLTQDIQVVQQTWFARGGCATLYKGFLHVNDAEDRKVVSKTGFLYRR